MQSSASRHCSEWPATNLQFFLTCFPSPYNIINFFVIVEGTLPVTEKRISFLVRYVGGGGVEIQPAKSRQPQ